MYVDLYPARRPRRPWLILFFSVCGLGVGVGNKVPYTTVLLLITCPAGTTRLLVHIFTLDVAHC